MAAPIWPPILPQKPHFSGYSEALPNAQLRSEMGNGTKVRPKGNSLPDVMEVNYILTEEQYQALRSFYRYTLVQGVKAFDYPHPVSGDYIRVGIVPDSKEVIKRTNTSPYAKDLCQVSLTLEVFTNAIIT